MKIDLIYFYTGLDHYVVCVGEKERIVPKTWFWAVANCWVEQRKGQWWSAPWDGVWDLHLVREESLNKGVA